ncbi:IspD/TarI family cytidylyltransferase [Bacteroides caecigallinarum]|uniref:IspD/TarI family cytidylyltransferase n=1 Tax=Bacteroides caecigallinarum TaxID=1411144 RepID=UPI0019597477|nr:IspD/TarI family cytidylyltransferase [Bacteroides caecigallinarum]MBM6882077.1 2-C-methyl-D-erythritol 4-phosphate cytidylyltransferase [Bacteroides caecigallinarum]MCF2551702.1 2-C-methyl-D-erythritol 4-phosphate cytidylyltransferase [Bacteroides caecigallinarum]
MSRKIAFVMAGGYGDRMHKETPKQFLDLLGKPVIIHTLLKFEQSNDIDVIIVACLSGWIDKLRKMAAIYNITKLKGVVEGGCNSQESISNGIEYMLLNGYNEDDIVMVHESVRPFITDKIISDNVNSCMLRGNAVTAIRGNESYLYSENGISSEQHFMRENMFMVQTPQTFKLGCIASAINEANEKGIVSQSLYILMSQLDYTPLYMVDGDRFNLKLTYPEDLKIFEILLKMNIR